ncbi:N-acetyltransferase [Campylobacter sp. MIT 99-7217]|uniref:GNAT family N-acetyltransferase n=1 Tax=Campylobacter sp. MIT 99-7217 TaxID=535091 RepID=UPI0011576EBA|nr:GNAT family N-acetyltransferase [Campylobacter sp. MIT 99-7217]TQR33747.1 N-acetyltransferase [Campylobacter sp. MIT 99-7217]
MKNPQLQNILNQSFPISSKSINMRLVQVSDASFILELRSNVNKNKFLSPTTQTLKAQEEWIYTYKQREKENKEFYFVIESKSGEKLGVVRTYDFRDNSFCWGSWIIKDEAPADTAIQSVLQIYIFAFEILGFEQSHFDVRKQNSKVIAFHKRFGAKIIREDEDNFYFIFLKKDFEITKTKYKKYLTPTDMGGGYARYISNQYLLLLKHTFIVKIDPNLSHYTLQKAS